MARVSKYILPPDIQKLQYEANQRLAKLEQSYARNERKSTLQAIEFLQKRAGTYNAPAERFTFTPAKGSEKSLEQQLAQYKKGLEAALQTKTTVTDINIADRKRKKSIGDYLGTSITWKQYNRLFDVVEEQGDRILYNIKNEIKSLKKGKTRLTEHEKGKQVESELVNSLLDMLEEAGKTKIPAVDYVERTKVLEYVK